MRTFASAVAIAAIALSLVIPANAQSIRTWVSHNGTFNNSCTQASPCVGSFGVAELATLPGGEINCLDSSSSGYVGIYLSVTIDCSGQLGTIDADPVNLHGINIDAPGAVVKLRNLTINGHGSTGSGVLIKNAAAVIIENCVIQGFAGNGGTGIFVQTTNALQLNVSDTLIASNTDGVHNAGILISPTGSGPTTFALDRVRVENNTNLGVMVDGSHGNITGVIRDSQITGSINGSGVVAYSNATAVTVSLDHTHVAGNNTGVTSSNGAAVILNNSTIQTNGRGLSTNFGGAIFSYGNNPINGNQPNGSAAPTVIGLH
jgi:hypothetical protein